MLEAVTVSHAIGDHTNSPPLPNQCSFSMYH